MNHEMEKQPMALARREELVVQEMPDEVLVYDLRQHKAHCLNKTAAFIWDHCDGQTTVADLTRHMIEEFKTPVNESMVWQALDHLGKANLLTELVRRPNGEKFRSRRAMLGKLGTAAMLSVPLVTTIIAPQAAFAATIPAPCIPCAVFGSGANRNNTCPIECDATVLGRCFNNASCDTGGGGLLASNISCNDCFTNFPGPANSSSGWRAP